MEDLNCPECGGSLTEDQLRESMICPHCKKNLRNPKYLDFLELLVFHDIVEDIDFFDMNLYGQEMLNEEREDYDEPDIDPSKFEKRKEIWDEFEDEIDPESELQEEENLDEAWNIFDDDIPLDDVDGWDDLDFGSSEEE
jgi:hypothetical protein